MTRPRDSRDSVHLDDSQLFALALPPAGEPEALPAHLSECLACSRALSEWKSAVRDLAAEEAAPVARRSEAEWRRAENRTLEAVRGARIRRPLERLRWALTIAACLLLVALALPVKNAVKRVRTSAATSDSGFTAQDQADDALLRDVARLSRAEEGSGSWTSLAPEPAPARPEDKL